MKNAMVEVKNLRVASRLNIQSLFFFRAQLTFILGENGAGKSSLLSAISGLESQHDEQVIINGKVLSDWPLSLLASFRCWLGQQTVSPFALSVKELLYFYAADAMSSSTPNWFSKLEIHPLMNRQLATLSGGELQRVNLARVLLQVATPIEKGEALVVLDEPLTALDLRHQFQTLSLLESLAKMGNCIVMSSHQPKFAAVYADEIIMLKHGSIIASGTADTVLTGSNLSACYGMNVESLAPDLIYRD